MRWILPAVSGVIVWLSTGCSPTTTERLALPELKTVDNVDLSRYLGKWYEIASFPQGFQEGCTATTTEYIRNEEGFRVINLCRRDTLDGRLDQIVGQARVVDATSNAKLEVAFFWPFWGAYWIIDLGPGYEYAVVSHPSRDYLWILSRRSTLPKETYQGILERLSAQGFELDRLKVTRQPPE